MISPLRVMLWSALSLALSACSVVNNDHCGNQENGNTVCLQRDPAAPYCSICVADNNGCLAAAPATNCIAETAPATSADATSSAGTTTATSTTTTVDPPTSTSTGTTAPSTPTTTTPLDTSTSSSSGDTSTSSGDTSTSTGDTSTGTSTGDTSTSTGDTSTGTGDTSTSTSDTTTGGPVCGNNTIEGDEVCDGNNFGGETCKTVMPVGKWGGGSLGCNRCMSLNDSKCCVGLNGACGGLAPDAKLPCCGGLTCKADGLNGYKCKSQ